MMWPLLLDMTKEESMHSLRKLELEAYAHLVSALRAQGPLNSDKRKLLKETSAVLNISQDRHKAEVRRAINDEKLNTIAYHVTGQPEANDDWAQEGRRSVPLIPRMAPQTVYSAIADEAADSASQTNRQLPPPPCTERKRPPPLPPTPISMPESSKTLPFRIPEPPRGDDSKKRKLPLCTEASTLALQLLGPPKMSRTQQFYRQRTKALMKEHAGKLKLDVPKLPPNKVPTLNGPKVNVLQNVSLQSTECETIEQIQNEINNYPVQKQPDQNHAMNPMPGCSNENQAPPARPKLLTNLKSTIAFKSTGSPGPSGGDAAKTFKVCPSRKTLAKPAPLGQKLIVVSNAQTIPSSSILQKTLSIPLVKNVSIKNLEKFKIVTTSSVPTTLQITTSASMNSLKHKVVTVKTNPTKKVIPLSQLLHTKGGIKVLPIGGKIVAKTTTTSAAPLYITMGSVQSKTPVTTAAVVTNMTDSLVEDISITTSPSKENGKSSVLGDILKASGVTCDDYDARIEEFRIPNNHVIDQTPDSVIEEPEETPEKQDVAIHDDDETDAVQNDDEDNSQHEILTDSVTKDVTNFVVKQQVEQYSDDANETN